MDNDLLVVIGVILFALSLPALLNAVTHGIPPRGALLALVVGGAMTGVGIVQHPGSYQLSDVPESFARVYARYID
ncbi:hypothetical protein [Histidinibacterium aquaticum]|uniref:Uncharacterized protein n=1 Tax=Histidinibacterium aquaticum TaxID=2613962 RepID=A0A5J5GSJ0_9RHOB|nr:hypothetical protein [Histidinibacterium aquaticum]KAA9010524.1 hypothetical protein F3S47_04570 [Histidinibacterium aquaticum]